MWRNRPRSMRRALPSPSWLLWAVYAPPLLLLALYAAGYVEHGWCVATFPFQIDYGEAPELNRALRLSRGEPIYVDWSQPPYQMANYTPLYPAVVSLVVRFTGPDFLPGRLLSFGSALASAVLVALTVRALGGGGPGAVAAALLWLSGHPVWNWGAFQRVDSFAVFLELLGLFVFCAGWVVRRRPAAVWGSMLLFVAATYTRQTVAAGAFACCAYLLFRRTRLGLGAIGAYAGMGLSLFALLLRLTEGQLWRHVVEGNLNGWTWATVKHYVTPLWDLQHGVAILAAAGCALALLGRHSQLPLLYLLASGATALTVGKIGANVNYLFQVCAALALCAGLCLGHVSRLTARVPPAAVLHVAVSLWLLVTAQQLYHVPFAWDGTLGRPLLVRATDRLQTLRWPLWRLDPLGAPPGVLATRFKDAYLADPTPEERAAAQRAHEHVARIPGDVLSEDMSFTVTTGRRLYLQPFEFTQLAEQGDWDQGPLLADVRARRFGAVVLRFDVEGDPTWHAERVNRQLIDAIREAYARAAVYGDYFLYTPRPG